MASVLIQCGFADGDVLTVRVKAESSFPDAIAEARAEAITTFKGALEELLAVEGDG